jgi:uncharacterized protein
MSHNAREMKFLAALEKGEVSALLIRPEGATHLLVLGHGASTNMRHATLHAIADRLAEVGIATFRYNFPYSENGKGRDGQAVCTETIRSAVAAARKAAPDLPLLAGGHSFSGRMTSTAASESPLEGVHGLVFFSFPLHLAGKPETKRADHLADVTVPMLFLSGTRDELANPALLKPACEKLGSRATLHLLDTADHGYKVLKKSRTSDEDVFVEMARVARDWAASSPPNCSRSRIGIGEIKRLSFLACWSAGERGSVDLDDRPRSTTSGTPARCGLAAGRSLPRSASALRIGFLVGYPSRH